MVKQVALICGLDKLQVVHVRGEKPVLELKEKIKNVLAVWKEAVSVERNHQLDVDSAV